MDDKQIQAARAMMRPFTEAVAQITAGLEQGLQRSPAVASMVRGMEAVKKSVWSLPISRELALDHGLVEPTPEERAQAERDAAEAEQRRAEHAAKLERARFALGEIVEEPARTILDLHAEVDGGDCGGCDVYGDEAYPPDWPCTTTVTIARHYGIDLPEGT